MQRPTRCVCAFYSSLVAVALCRIRTTSSDALVYDNGVPLDPFRTRDQSRSACLRALDTIARIVGANRGAVEQGRPHDISHSTDPVRLRLSPVNIALMRCGRVCARAARVLAVILCATSRLQAQPTGTALERLLETAYSLQQDGDRALSRGDAVGARRLMHAALSLYRTTGDAQFEAGCLTPIGNTFAKTGQRDSALFYHRAAIQLWRMSDSRPGLANALHDIGMLLDEIGMRDSARTYLRESLALSRDFAGGRSGLRAVTLMDIGMVWQRMGQNDSASFYYSEAYGLLKANGLKARMATLISNLALLALNEGRSTASVDSLFRFALILQRETGDRAGEASTLNNLGMLFSVSARPDSALVYYRAALAAQRVIGARADEATALSNIAMVMYRTGQRDGARAALARASWLRATIATSAPGDAFRVASLEDAGSDLTSLWARLALAPLAGREPPGTWHADTLEAWGALERGRVQALRALRRSGALNEDSLAAQRGGATTGAIFARLARAGRAFVTFDQWRDTLLILAVSPSGTRVAALIPIRDDTLNRLVARTRALLGARGLQRSAVGQSLPLNVIRTARDRSIELRSSDGAAVDSAASRRLAQTLFAPGIRAAFIGATELVVIPDGPLSLVPWAALPVETSSPLGAAVALRVVPSLTLLDVLSSTAATRPPGRVTRAAVGAAALIVGDPAMPPGVPALPGARAEAHWVADTLFAAQRSRTLLVDRSATVQAVRDRLASATLVHFATHAAAFPEASRARGSFLQLAAVDSGASVITVGELLDASEAGRLTLRARLVVLSACETGIGASSTTEGVLGLQRAFLALGAESMLVSLWKVDDGATRALMGAFYRHWLDDPDAPTAAESLRRAQANMRTGSVPGWQRSWSLPNAWAAFQVIGAG